MQSAFSRLSAAIFSVIIGLAIPALAEDSPTVAIYDLEGILSETGIAEESFADLGMAGSRPLTMTELSLSLQAAAKDPNLKGVVLDLGDASVDFSQIQEIRRLLIALREKEKDVWLYSETLSNGIALLGSAANHFALMPEADSDFNGLLIESLYFKGMLDHLGIRAEVIHIGDYKSLGEHFYQSGPSDFARQQEESLADSFIQQWLSDIATGRKISIDDLKKLMDRGWLSPKDAVDAKLADKLQYRTDFVAELHEHYGDETHFDHEYKLASLDGPEINSLLDLMKLAFSDSSKSRGKEDFIAVVAMEGDISDESIAPVRTEILELAKDPRAKGLILRVNSPGGSALASEVLWEATDEWNATKKPFVVSMGGVAASGGYYISSAANRIFAEASTITGSIGVIGIKFVIKDAMEKIGITTHRTQRGKFAAIMSPFESFSTEEAAAVRESMQAVYQTFKQRIIDGRGKALKKELESIAGGRVFTGEDALEVGLVDEIGGLDTAIAYLKNKTGMKEPIVRLCPPPMSGLEGLFTKPDADDDDELIRAGTDRPAHLKLKSWLGAHPASMILPQEVIGQMLKIVTRIDQFSNDRVLLLGPSFDVR
ncbi:MAG: signal peptide peptidase SppA [Verrucomicrobia bacterium]|nr:MAG: signal peptide peptidase SppA [Verrucomicrobiota bacterium]